MQITILVLAISTLLSVCDSNPTLNEWVRYVGELDDKLSRGIADIYNDKDLLDGARVRLAEEEKKKQFFKNNAKIQVFETFLGMRDVVDEARCDSVYLNMMHGVNKGLDRSSMDMNKPMRLVDEIGERYGLLAMQNCHTSGEQHVYCNIFNSKIYDHIDGQLEDLLPGWDDPIDNMALLLNLRSSYQGNSAISHVFDLLLTLREVTGARDGGEVDCDEHASEIMLLNELGVTCRRPLSSGRRINKLVSHYSDIYAQACGVKKPNEKANRRGPLNPMEDFFNGIKSFQRQFNFGLQNIRSS